MKKRLFLLPFFVFCNAYAAAPQSEVQPLIEQFNKADTLCRSPRGVSPGHPYCRIRDQVGEQLQRKGWCYEAPKDGSPDNLGVWKPCPDQPSTKNP